MKIIQTINEAMERKQPFFSFEYFPPKTEAGLYNLYNRIERMIGLEPAFIDITWGSGGSTVERTFEMSSYVQKYFGIDVLMHLTCSGMSRAQMRDTLKKTQDAGIRNILALRGDSYHESNCEFKHALDLVRFIREEFKDYFCLAVAGYPEGHPEEKSVEKCALYLRQKLDAGADFVVTQLFYDIKAFRSFLQTCKKVGITKPIIPGIMPIHNYQRFQKFVESCELSVPQSLQTEILRIKDNDEEVQNYGVEVGTNMCRDLAEIEVPGFHIYTLNLETSTTRILEGLDFLRDSRGRRSLPWRKSTLDERSSEQIRPIYWSNRPKSYLARTMAWDDFPNGRWGNSFSPTFGDLTDYYLFRKPLDNIARTAKLQAWGEPKTISDISKIFENYCAGKIDRLPWCESPVHAETSRIGELLIEVNKQGFWTINSQPQINGASSSDPVVGWGGPGGYVYQKAYLEFFTTREKLQWLLEKTNTYPNVQLQASNLQGEIISSSDERSVTAVTWGVFPRKEITQPTVVDTDSFMIWKDEAFQLWIDEWCNLYSKDSPSFKLLTELHESLFLVNIVENDFIEGNIFKYFAD